MRILLAALIVGLGALFGATAQAADIPEYPDIEIPEVDYGLEGGFYLRGSAAANHRSTALGCFLRSRSKVGSSSSRSAARNAVGTSSTMMVQYV